MAMLERKMKVPDAKTQKSLLTGPEKLAGDVAKGVLATPETMASVGTGLVAWPVSKLLGGGARAGAGITEFIASMAQDRPTDWQSVADIGQQVEEQAMEKLSYVPQFSPTALESVEKIGKGFETLLTPVKKYGELVPETHPNVRWMTELATELLMFKGLHKVGSKASKALYELDSKVVEAKRLRGEGKQAEADAKMLEAMKDADAIEATSPKTMEKALGQMSETLKNELGLEGPKQTYRSFRDVVGKGSDLTRIEKGLEKAYTEPVAKPTPTMQQKLGEMGKAVEAEYGPPTATPEYRGVPEMLGRKIDPVQLKQGLEQVYGKPPAKAPMPWEQVPMEQKLGDVGETIQRTFGLPEPAAPTPQYRTMTGMLGRKSKPPFYDPTVWEGVKAKQAPTEVKPKVGETKLKEPVVKREILKPEVKAEPGTSIYHKPEIKVEPKPAPVPKAPVEEYTGPMQDLMAEIKAETERMKAKKKSTDLLDERFYDEPKQETGLVEEKPIIKEELSEVKETAEKREFDMERFEEEFKAESTDALDFAEPFQEDLHMAGDSPGRVGLDLVDIFSNERGSSPELTALVEGIKRKFFPEKEITGDAEMAAIQRMQLRAKKTGTEFKEFLAAQGLTPGAVQNIIKKVQEFERTDAEVTKMIPLPVEGKVINKAEPRTVNGVIIEDVPITDAELKIVRDTPDLNASSWKDPTAFRNPIRQFEQAGLKEVIYRHYTRAEKRRTEKLEARNKVLKTLDEGMTDKSWRRVGAYLTGKQEGGMEILKSMGRKMPELTTKEIQTAEAIRSYIDKYFESVNQVRTKIGQKPMKKLSDYFTFMRTSNRMEKLGLEVNPYLAEGNVFKDYHKHKSKVPFRFAKLRGESALPVELHALDVLRKYTDSAIKFEEMAPVVRKVHQLSQKYKIGEKPEGGDINFKMAHEKPNLDQFLTRWANHLAGVRPEDLRVTKPFENKMRWLNESMTYAILGANLRSAGIQATALANVLPEIGVGHTVKGIMSLVDPRLRNEALQLSTHLKARKGAHDANVAEIAKRASSNVLGKARKTVGQASMVPLKVMDYNTSMAAWQGGYKFAIEKLGMKKGSKEAINYADDLVVKTQGSGLPGDIAPIQYSALGKALTMFQTFTINNWEMVTKDFAGLNKGAKPTAENLAKVMKYVTAVTLMNYLLEDKMGVRSPTPRPIQAGQESLKELQAAVDHGDANDIMAAIAKVPMEFAELIPVISSGRIDDPLGPLAGMIGDAFEVAKGDPQAPHVGELVSKVLGIGGTVQAGKTLRAAERGEGPVRMALGSDIRKSGKKPRRKSF